MTDWESLKSRKPGWTEADCPEQEGDRMQVHLTPAALEALRSKRPEPGAGLRMAAITEGCGCGATILYELNWDIPRPEDTTWERDGVRLVMDSHSRMYFDSELTIDYHPEKDTFTFRSPNQIYLNHIRL
ncbi:Fe-S cluster assembly iron-binding protein IscA [Melghirimyces profundicolus]|uniref:Fe-S cluster assembly iron-binding protein IscA n=1 Tax=Melghirimyces profundicolus TaxID=1242148 RepID=A0A2T6C9S8_9BACL|nr:iron-sulfur cluster biosynthesis family protein [Melghirimyces profundicolus]PTX65062.1 Fe-S cluster assembly iron-binding protein IscA [Melghirimyces profundicolus]